MLKNVFIAIFLLCTLDALSQVDDKLYDKYSEVKYTGFQIADLADSIDFIPRKLHDGQPISRETFKVVCLSLSDRAWNQINIDAPYKCSTKHEEYFRLWNILYKSRPVTWDVWDEYCCPLMILMLLDGTVKSR